MKLSAGHGSYSTVILISSLPEVSYFLKEFTIFRPNHRACEMMGLAGTAPKAAYFLRNFMLFTTLITRVPGITYSRRDIAG